jgi:hypothetical protein
MKLLLASDACACGEIQDDEYKRIQSEADKDLDGVNNLLKGQDFAGLSLLKDKTFLPEFRSILDADQIRKMDESMAREALNSPPPVAGSDKDNISNMPKMELEKLDTTIQATRKMTAGFKSMIEGLEGMGGLKDELPPAPPVSGEN